VVLVHAISERARSRLVDEPVQHRVDRPGRSLELHESASHRTARTLATLLPPLAVLDLFHVDGVLDPLVDGIAGLVDLAAPAATRHQAADRLSANTRDVVREGVLPLRVERPVVDVGDVLEVSNGPSQRALEAERTLDLML